MWLSREQAQTKFLATARILELERDRWEVFSAASSSANQPAWLLSSWTGSEILKNILLSFMVSISTVIKAIPTKGGEGGGCHMRCL